MEKFVQVSPRLSKFDLDCQKLYKVECTKVINEMGNKKDIQSLFIARGGGVIQSLNQP